MTLLLISHWSYRYIMLPPSTTWFPKPRSRNPRSCLSIRGRRLRLWIPFEPRARTKAPILRTRIYLQHGRRRHLSGKPFASLPISFIVSSPRSASSARQKDSRPASADRRGFASRIVNSYRDGGQAASRQPLRPKVVTYVASRLCYLCLRAGPV